MSLNTNCDKCGQPLRLQDLKSRKYIHNREQFTFKCSLCGFENESVSEVFDDKGHIGRKYLAMIKDDKDYINYLPKRLFDNVLKHFQNCDTCKNRFNEEFLKEVENKVRFDNNCYNFFEKNGQFINKPITTKTENESFSFTLNRKRYNVKRSDVCFQDSQRVCYYIKSRIFLVGMVSFKTEGKTVILERIWLRPKEQVEKEKQVFKKIRQQKNKIHLSTVQKIFETLKK